MPTTGPRYRKSQGERTAVWLLPDTLEETRLLADLEIIYPVRVEPQRTSLATWFDSFDWRLYSHGLLLYHDRKAWHLVQRDSTEVLAVLDAPGKEQWRFCREFPAGRIRSLLEPLVANRSLLPLFASETATVGWRVLNRDDKTLALVLAETQRVAGRGPVMRTLRLQGVRGYPREFEELYGFFRKYGIMDQADLSSFFAEGVRSAGRVPLDYSARFRPSLKPEMTARQAMVAIYLELLTAMQRNEPGVLLDLDPEFLHDFRVAVRRTRSGLGQVRKVLPPRITEKCRREFAWLGSITGPARDLDVFLEAENSLRNRLPDLLQEAIAPFFTDLRSRRAHEMKLLSRRLRSKRFRKLITSWRDFLVSGAEGEAMKYSGQPVDKLARRIITRRFRLLLETGRALGPVSPDQEYHRLRIHGKKLRYTLEFFFALFPQEAMESAIKQLKHLQDNLGAANDLAVQQAALRECFARLRPGSRRDLDLAAAIGGLLTSLREEQDRLRTEFAGRFTEFSRPEHTELYTSHCRR